MIIWQRENYDILFGKKVKIHTSDHHIEHILGHLRAFDDPRFEKVKEDISKHIQEHQMMLYYIAKKEENGQV